MQKRQRLSAERHRHKGIGFFMCRTEKKGYYRRTDFIGALKRRICPEWAKENTQKYLEPDEPADEPDETAA